MKKPIKASLIIFGLALLACIAFLVWLGSRPDERDEALALNTSGVPRFQVNVDRPRSDRAFFGIFPTKLEAKLFGVSELRFDQASSGAKIGSVGNDRIELRADGWDLHIENNGQGAIASGTRLVFPMEIAGHQYTLRCRPADQPAGYLQATMRGSSGLLDGRFVIELAKCETAETGKILDTEAGGRPGQAWPSAPLTLRGSFQGLPVDRR